MKLAAIGYVHGQGEDIDVLLNAVATMMQADGVKLAGAVQWNVERIGRSRCDMKLLDLATGNWIDASDINRAATACRLDPWALEDAAGLVASSIKPGVELVILNRFGKQEVAGQGFRSAIEAAIANEMPVLLSVNANYREAFDAFSGGEAVVLPAEIDAVTAWCRAAVVPGK